MQKLLIRGKKDLSGTIAISGSKNASLPILAASILGKNIRLSNVPFVKDIFTMIELLKFIGIKVKIIKTKNIIKIENKKKIINTLAPYKLVRTMRAGVLVLGPMVSKFKKAKCEVFGISKDSLKSHKKFKEKYKIKFELLSDEEKKSIKAYKTWGKKKFMGKEFMGQIRSTFLIKDNKILNNKSVKGSALNLLPE